jgi:biotin operon repressor
MGKLSPEERAAHRTAIADRQRQVAELARDRVPQQLIAQQLGVSEATVSQDVKALRKGWEWPERPMRGRADRGAGRALDQDEARLRALFRRQLASIEAAEQGLAGGIIYHIPEGEKQLRRQVVELVAAVQDVRPVCGSMTASCASWSGAPGCSGSTRSPRRPLRDRTSTSSACAPMIGPRRRTGRRIGSPSGEPRGS